VPAATPTADATPSNSRPVPTGSAQDVPLLAARLRLGATRLSRRLRSEAHLGLAPSLLSSLATVHLEGPLTLGELAEREGLAKPSITKIVGRLEERGLVERCIDASDRRVCRVETTAAGEALLAESRERKDAWLAARLAHLDEDRRTRLAAAIEILDELTRSEELRS
jgi:DNA-binding MarR family transcriptional regulator